MTEVQPCQMCGSPVRVVPVRIRDRGLNDTATAVEPRRVCTNPKCPSKGPDRPLSAVV